MSPTKRAIIVSLSLVLALAFIITIFFLTQKPAPADNKRVQIRRCPQEPCTFYFEDGILLINTDLLVMNISGGAITYVVDKASGEVLVDSAAFVNWPSDTAGFVSFTAKTANGRSIARQPSESSTVTFTMVEPNYGRLIYILGTQDTKMASQLTIDIMLDQLTGEVILQLVGLEADPDTTLVSIDLPILNTTTPSVILGSGASYSRTDARATDQTTYTDYGLYSPTMVVIQGSGSVIGAWSETIQFSPEYILLKHKRNYDQIVLHAEQVDGQADSDTITSPPWRIGTYPTWVDAARRWKVKFEERTGAKPLWENRVSWVRNIHAIFNSTYQDYGNDAEKYAELARKTSPEKTLFFLWNGDRIVLFGDHTLADVISRPTPETLEIVGSYGWPLLLYYPYNLIYSEEGTTDRLLFLSEKGWLPESYEFRPDYAGSPQHWQNYWADVRADYYDGSKFYVIHPGSSKFTEYLIRNFSNYLSLYQANGAYFDTLGADQDFLFSDDMKIIDENNYVLGEINSIAAIENALPASAIMSEYQSPSLLPFVFYSWEGSATHLQSNKLAGTRITHPLRVALVGSYSWSRESNEDYTDDVVSALMGSLPQISLIGDSGVSDEKALWSQARAKLFCDEELFNDLPDQWENDVLAYYRSQNTGHWFKFKYIGSTYGYVEILDDGTEVLRLIK